MTNRIPRHDVPSGGRSGFALVGGRQVHYLEWGGCSEPPIVCLHGGGQTAYMFEDLGDGLSPGHHILAPDLPGHGDSDPIEDIFGADSMARTVPGLLDEFRMGRAVFIGASLGGLTSVCFAADHPEMCRAIVLIDIGHRVEPEGVRRIVDFMARHESFGSLEEAAAEIAVYLPGRREVRPESLTRNLRLRDDGRWEWKHGFGEQIRQLPSEDHPAENIDRLLAPVREAAPRLRCPVLILRGANSDVLSEEGAGEISDLIPDARLGVIAKAGHLAAGDNPESTLRQVAGFLDELGW